MDRFVTALVAGAAVTFLLAGTGFAQGPGPGQNGGNRPAFRQGNGGIQMRPMRDRWRQLSPEQRQRIRMNAARWLQLPPQERQELRFRQGLRQERMRREAEAALQRSGLQLEAEKRAAYERRYLEERKRIDRQLRQELQERRQREMAPVVDRLTKEFSPQNPQPRTSGGEGASAAGSPKK